MPLLVPYSQAPPRPGGKRRLAAIVVAVAVVFAGVAVLAAVHPGGYGQSRAGCVTVTIPSSTGGALLHACGAWARSLCRHALRDGDRMSRLIRPACRQAGLGSVS